MIYSNEEIITVEGLSEVISEYDKLPKSVSWDNVTGKPDSLGGGVKKACIAVAEVDKKWLNQGEGDEWELGVKTKLSIETKRETNYYNLTQSLINGTTANTDESLKNVLINNCGMGSDLANTIIEKCRTAGMPESYIVNGLNVPTYHTTYSKQVVIDANTLTPKSSWGSNWLNVLSHKNGSPFALIYASAPWTYYICIFGGEKTENLTESPSGKYILVMSSDNVVNAGSGRQDYKIYWNCDVWTIEEFEAPIIKNADALLTTDTILREQPTDLSVYDNKGKLKVSEDAVKALIPESRGVPAGGTAGQILAKSSATDYDIQWVEAPKGGVGVTTGTRSYHYENIVTSGDNVTFDLAIEVFIKPANEKGWTDFKSFQAQIEDGEWQRNDITDISVSHGYWSLRIPLSVPKSLLNAGNNLITQASTNDDDGNYAIASDCLPLDAVRAAVNGGGGTASIYPFISLKSMRVGSYNASAEGASINAGSFSFNDDEEGIAACNAIYNQDVTIGVIRIQSLNVSGSSPLFVSDRFSVSFPEGSSYNNWPYRGTASWIDENGVDVTGGDIQKYVAAAGEYVRIMFMSKKIDGSYKDFVKILGFRKSDFNA